MGWRALGLLAVLVGCGADPDGLAPESRDDVAENEAEEEVVDVDEAAAPEPPDDYRMTPVPPTLGSLDSMPEFTGSFDLGYQTCVVSDDGRVACAGSNYHGALGVGTRRTRRGWVWARGLRDILSVTCAGDRACAIHGDGALSCWGRTLTQGLSEEAVLVPTRLPELASVVQVALSDMATCALLADGGVRCWGDPHVRGDPDVDDYRTLATPRGLPPIAQVGVGSSHACGRDRAGRVWCWGSGQAGEIGRGTREDATTPVQVPGLDDVVDLSVGARHACAVRRGGTLHCWGTNSRGQVGNGDDVRRHPEQHRRVPLDEIENGDVLAPVHVEMPPVARVSCGVESTCALMAQGGVACWGRRRLRRSYDEVEVRIVDRPSAIPGLDDAIAVEAGMHNCAVRAGGALHCWGSNLNGQQGVRAGERPAPTNVLEAVGRPGATATEPTVFAPIPGAARPTHVQLAAYDRDLCAVDTRGRLYCFESGAGVGRECVAASCGAGLVEALPDVVDVTFGMSHACALRADGTVACWGDGRDGALGSDVRTSSVPLLMGGVDDARQVVAGWGFTCVLHTSGEVSCLGSRDASIMGADHEGAARTPVRIEGLSGVVQLAAGSRHVCARTDDGRVLCWGDGNRGACGPDGRPDTPRPVAIPGIDDAVDLALGRQMACVIRGEDRRLTCWGDPEDGQVLGASTDSSSAGPTTPSYFRGVTRVAIGEHHMCALFADDVVRCWGRACSGCSGDGDESEVRVRSPVRAQHPEAVAALGPRDDIVCGGRFCCAHHTRGGLSCWGSVPPMVSVRDEVLGTATYTVPTPMPLVRLR